MDKKNEKVITKKRAATINIKCCVCKRESFVSGNWYTYNPLICKNKICVNVFKNLSDDMRVSLLMVNPIEKKYYHNYRDNCYQDSGSVYYKADGFTKIVISNPLKKGFCQNHIDDLDEEDYESHIIMSRLWIDEQSEFIINALKDIENDRDENGDGYTQYIDFDSYYRIWFKIPIEDINNRIKDLLNLERTISLSKELVEICNSADIDLYFCNKTEYSGFKTISIINN